MTSMDEDQEKRSIPTWVREDGRVSSSYAPRFFQYRNIDASSIGLQVEVIKIT